MAEGSMGFAILRGVHRETLRFAQSDRRKAQNRFVRLFQLLKSFTLAEPISPHNQFQSSPLHTLVSGVTISQTLFPKNPVLRI